MIAMSTVTEKITHPPTPGPKSRTSPSRQVSPTPRQRRMDTSKAAESAAGVSPRRSSTKSSSPSSTVSQRRASSSFSNITQAAVLERQYNMKRKCYMLMRKELSQKQKTTQKLFDEISQLREKMILNGTEDPGKMEEIKGSETEALKAAAGQCCDNSTESKQILPLSGMEVSNDIILNLNDKLKMVSKDYQELCETVLDKHLEITSNLLSQNRSTTIDVEERRMDETGEESGEAPNDAVITNDEARDNVSKLTSSASSPRLSEPMVSASSARLLEAHRDENAALKSRLEEIKTVQSETVAELIKSACNLYQEYESCRAQVRELTATLAEQKDAGEKLNSLLEELQSEKEKHSQTKERRSSLETHLQRARTKIRDLENRVSSDETKIQQLQASVKNLEAQLKKKDQAIEQRVKDMHKTMRNSEGLVAKMEKQRDSFEARLLELKEKMNAKETEAAAAVKEMNDKVEALTEELVQEREKRDQAELALAELEERYKDLEGKSQELCTFVEQSKSFTITDGNHTENELQLFNDLKEARVQVEEQREKIEKLQKEKEEIAALLHQAANEAENESKDKLLADLIVKSNEIRELKTENVKNQQLIFTLAEKNKLLEEQLADIQSRLHVQSKEGGKAAWSAHVMELQQQISDLRNSLTEATNHSAELETVLTQKQLELEQRDRIMREQSKFLKVRDELLSLLRGKEAGINKDSTCDEEHYCKDLNEINKQIAAKTEAIQELYATLENKQMQVMRLEKIVKQMEDHQEHAQAQRTRLENRIAQLELLLQEKTREHRSRGFGIL